MNEKVAVSCQMSGITIKPLIMAKKKVCCIRYISKLAAPMPPISGRMKGISLEIVQKLRMKAGIRKNSDRYL